MSILLLTALALADDRIGTVRVGVGVPDLLGGSASLTLARPLEVEIGGATGIIYKTAFARAGGALTLFEGRENGEGVLVEGLALGGYRYLNQVPWAGDLARHGAEVDLAVELTGWFAPHAAISLQLLGGAGAWIGTQPDGAAIFTDFRGTLGFAF